MNTQMIDLEQLRSHPANANVMPAALFDKLLGHLRDGDRYPPLIVRRLPSEAEVETYQILDGHHRARALRQLGHRQACCVVWEVDDQQALVLLATLNRLQGRDDPYRRAELVAELSRALDLKELARRLPERLEDLQALAALRQSPPPPRPPQDLEQMPVAVHFFLLPGQRRLLEQRLAQLGGQREQALMRLVQSASCPTALTA